MQSAKDDHSPKYRAALELLKGVDLNNLSTIYEDENEETAANTNNTDNKQDSIEQDKYVLKDQIHVLDTKIAKVDSAIDDLEVGKGLAFFGGVLVIGAGVASIGAGMNDISHDHVGLGVLEEMNGLMLLNMGMNDFDNAAQLSRVPLPQLRIIRYEFTKERTQIRKKLYEIEKNETLQVLNEHIKDKQSPLILAVNNQFAAIDHDIAEDKFSKTYIDVAINTRKIITAKTKKERDEYANKHVAITTKESVSTVVKGCMLLLAGVAMVITSFVLTVLFIEAGPFVLLGGAIGAISGVALGAKGISLIESGLARKRTPLLIQSMFNVVEKAKAEPEVSNVSYVMKGKNNR